MHGHNKICQFIILKENKNSDEWIGKESVLKTSFLTTVHLATVWDLL